MTSPISVSFLSDTKSRSYLYSIVVGASLIFLVYSTGSTFVEKDLRNRMLRWPLDVTGKPLDVIQNKTKSNFCKDQCRPPGSEALPEGIVVQTSNLDMRPLWDSSSAKDKLNASSSLLAMAVGNKQKLIVNKVIEKFLNYGFAVMLFHYDGLVSEWSDMKWDDRLIHVSAKNQTKWWFAKRFLHPDIVAKYEYLFLWDEDLDVENFHPLRYISIIKSEGLEISQPALDGSKSVVHHPLTARQKEDGVHRRYYKFKGSGRCDENSTAPPCLGWVEMMAPVFSRAAWQCVWYMIQNDLIHAWGLDRQLGYCAQGNRAENVGVVDSEYVVHLGLSTLGALDKNKGLPDSVTVDNKPAVRRQSYVEMQKFSKRWDDAVKNAKCWIDVYKENKK